MGLHQYLSKFPRDQREEFARRCDTTLGHLNNVMYGYKPCSIELAVAIERESDQEIAAESLCPQAADAISYLRSTSEKKAAA